MFSYLKLKDPSYFSENRLPAHSDHIIYASEEELFAGESSYQFKLNGIWKLQYACNETQVVSGFERLDVDCHNWNDIPVPAHLQLEGFGKPQYANTEYPWDGTDQILPGELPERKNPVASYVKYFYLPVEMKDKRVFISFQGVESCIALWLNGQYIGYASDSFTVHEFELTSALVDGQNKLACRVYRWNAGSWLEDQDFLRFSGIYRDVWLYSIPQAHLNDIRIHAEPDINTGGGKLTCHLALNAPEGANITARLIKNQRELWTTSCFQSEETVTLETTIPNVLLWSAEKPELYDLILVITSPDGQEEWVRERVGFRKFEKINNIMCLNGKRIVFKGVNRHDFCAETGRHVPEDKVRKALLLMKRNNINAIRTSHYPNSSCLYRLCDELGFYVIDENNMESHGMWDMYWQGRIEKDEIFPGNRMEWAPMLLDRVHSTYERDKNHPCILIWSCGNESLCGQVIVDMANEFRRLDAGRLVHYEGDCHMEPDMRRREATDIETTMYTPADQIRSYLKEHRDKPYILCEYTHSMGNSNGAMHKYTELAYEEALYQGGFIWDFVDQSLVRQLEDGSRILEYGGDWDDRPTDGIFCGNGIVFGDGNETPKLQAVKANYQNLYAILHQDGILIHNRYMFTDSDQFSCIAILARDGCEVCKKTLNVSIPPLGKKTIPFPFSLPQIPGEYTITLSFRLKEEKPWAEIGFETDFYQFILGTVTSTHNKQKYTPLVITDSPWNIGVRGDTFSVLYSRLSGALVSYRFGDIEYLKSPIMPDFWRAPVNNDYGNHMPQRYAQWKLASLYASTSLTKETGDRNFNEHPVTLPDGSVRFSFVYDLPTVPAATCQMIFTIHPDGKLTTKLIYNPIQGLPAMPNFGILFRTTPDHDHVRYYGLGPDENYIDRKPGARLGIWEYDVRKNMTPYLLPQECGNRTDVRWAEITNARGHGLRLELNGGEFSVLPWTPHEIENATHHNELPPVRYSVVRVSGRQMGVAGDDSWGAHTHTEYLIDVTDRIEYEFSIIGIRG